MAIEARAAGICIVGTAAGVGKTVVARGLVRELVHRGMQVAVSKPVETGCAVRRDDAGHAELSAALDGSASSELAGRRHGESPAVLDGEALAAIRRLEAVAGPPPPSVTAGIDHRLLVPADALQLREAAGCERPLEQVNPYRYAPALGPAVAAALAERPISIAGIAEGLGRLGRDADVLVVEGTGGLLVPLSQRESMVDLIAASGLATLIVGPCVEGTVSQCLLTLEVLRRRGMPVCGVVLNRLDADPPRPEQAAHPQLIDAFAGDVVRGVLPFIEASKLADTDLLAQRFRVHVDVDRLLEAAGF